ncbi:VWA domain-containing protein [Paenibacillus campinasensis]|uniref:VWA domain-containing protein n=1 Tax=Paenibacillus campinasensis TaxID=66347 RepID=A0ABW9T6R0_9BACL|nr:VWA domain-containing protein [Paenibacillus campinasensis]MUG68337.1 VWA domain-containing protein [Paenibacillus campinasensis]
MGIQSWVSLWFGLTLPAIVLMYMFKRKYVDMAVPSHLLWDRVLRNLEANRPWQKLQNRLLLWLQLLVAALLVFALMQPFLQVSGGGSAHIVIIADTSGSMSAEAGPTDNSEGGAQERTSRLDLMKERIREYVRDHGQGSDITLLAAGASPITLLSREGDSASLQSALEQLRPYYGPASYRETLSLASALTREESDAEVVIFTDGYWKRDEVEVAYQVPVSVESIAGDMLLNASIDQFGVSPRDEAGLRHDAVAVISLTAQAAAAMEVSLYGDEQLLASKVVELTPDARATVSFPDLPLAEIYRIELAGDDGYAADNEAYAFSRGHGTSRVLLLTSGNLFLEKALQLSGAEVTRIATGIADEAGADAEGTEETGTADNRQSSEASPPPVPDGAFDVIVMDGSVPDSFKQGEWAKLTASVPLWTIGGEGARSEQPGGRAAISTHPVMSYITLNDVYFGAVTDQGQAPVWGEAIARIGDTPLIHAGKEGGRPRLAFHFLLQDSDLPLSPEFPVLVSNALEWMTAGKGTGLGRYIAGAQADIPIAAGTVKAGWAAKGGLALAEAPAYTEAAETAQGVSPVQTVPDIPGLYAFEQENRAGEKISYWLSVAPDPFEGDWSERREPNIVQTTAGSGPEQAGEGTDRSEQNASSAAARAASLMPWLAALALAVIAAEWGVYQRGRSV